MENLIQLLSIESVARVNEFKANLEQENDVNQMLSKWQYKDLLTAADKKKNYDVDNLKLRLIARKELQANKSLTEKVNRVKTVLSAGNLVSAEISVEWTKSRTWGMNPKASMRYIYLDNEGQKRWYTVESRSVSGAGYDKLSTAVAECINQSNEVLKAMYLLKDSNPETENRDLFSYGSGYGILPYFEGGVGVSCYPRIFEKLGFEFITGASGKTFDTFRVEPLKVAATV